MSNSQPAPEVYQHGHHASVVSNHAKRTAERTPRFFLPDLESRHAAARRRLRTGLDHGGLARRVAPGPTIGIDTSESVIDTARSLRTVGPRK